MSDLPKASVVIPCYNAEQWIAESIQSALDQTWPNVEVIVIDDGSTDNSREVIAGFGDRIRFEFGPNRGGAAARNRGLDLSKGDWVQFLDADDILLPDCIERKLEMTDEFGDGIVPCCKIEYLDFESRNGEAAGPAHWKFEEHDLDTIIAYGAPQTSAPLLRLDQLLAIGGFRESLRQAQDFDLFLRLAAKFDLVFRSNQKVGVHIRPLHGSVSRSAGWCMHAAIADTLLNAGDILQEEGKLNDWRRREISQRATLYARRTAREGAIREGAAIVDRTACLAPDWYRKAYGNPLGVLVLRAIGFTNFERVRAFAVRYLGFSLS